MSTIKCIWCGDPAYAWRTTRFGKDAVCQVCVKNYPHEGSFEPFVPWSLQNSEDKGAVENGQPTSQG